MSKGLQFCRLVGMHPFVGIGMFAVDWMLFSAEVGTVGISWLISVLVGAVLTIPCILIQKYGMNEVWGLAIGKGMMVGVLTAIPTALPSLITFTTGAMGAVALLSKDRKVDKSDSA